jgi:ribulose bisphosphate carboxylase small subunit
MAQTLLQCALGIKDRSGFKSGPSLPRKVYLPTLTMADQPLDIFGQQISLRLSLLLKENYQLTLGQISQGHPKTCTWKLFGDKFFDLDAALPIFSPKKKNYLD